MMFSGSTRVVGLIGHPVAHSLSPHMHNAAFEASGLDWAYLPFPVAEEHLGEALSGLYFAGVAGLNVTVPHKLRVMEHLEGMSEEAMQIGAVNLLTRGKEGWIGDNTDGRGFIKALCEAGFNPRGKRVLLLGAGGAARAIVFALLNAGADEITLTNRTTEKAEALQDELAQHYLESEIDVISWEERDDQDVLNWVDLVINATTWGMGATSNDPSAISFAKLSANHRPLIADIVYSPLATPLITAARERGLTVVTGEKMLLYQGVMSWETWTGHPAPVAEMVRALVLALRN